MLGTPRLHLRSTDSTNERARALAAQGAAHGTLVTADEQTAGRGRQGRTWTAPPGRALLMSLILRDPPRLLPLLAAVAVSDVVEHAGSAALVKWPNDVLLADRRKVAGILVEGRPQERWAVLGVGLNVALSDDDFPPELRDRATTLGLDRSAIEPLLGELLGRIERWLEADETALLSAWGARDGLRGERIRWTSGEGVADGIDGEGRLIVRLDGGGQTELRAGEVHLARSRS
jgi:BirA family transcriptional regulator, biotin operon repressor / biotin---[acetyl-CoA-carboxylase] ligase